MPDVNSLIISFAIALGIGLLIGAERERRKGEGQSRGPAGIRTFAISSLGGAIAFTVGGQLLLAILSLGVIVLAAIAYQRANSEDPGLTTEIALILTVLLGALSMREPALAAGLGVTLAILLAARAPLHRFVRSVLKQNELTDALIFAGATLVILPLLPNRDMGPYGALNFYKIWILVILVMGITAMGYIATRWLGSRYGLPIAGLASGFISSTATIGAMAARATSNPAVLNLAAAGAILSTIATVIQLALVLMAVSPTTLRSILLSLILAGVAAVGYAAAFTIRALRKTNSSEEPQGHAFNLWAAVLFALALSVVLLTAAALQDWLGESGVFVAAGIAGFIDAHSAAVSVASLVASGKIGPSDAVLPILTAFSTNTASKIILSVSSGGRRFASRVTPGLILTVLAAWAGTYLG